MYLLISIDRFVLQAPREQAPRPRAPERVGNVSVDIVEQEGGEAERVNLHINVII